MEQKWWHLFIKIPMFILSWMYLCTFWIIFTILGNLYWIMKIFYKKEFKKTRINQKKIALKLNNFVDIMSAYYDFVYHLDGIIISKGIFGQWPTWGALPFVSIYRGLIGNCEDSAFYFNFLKKNLIKNNPEYANKIKSKLVIYINYFLWEGINPHWFIIVNINDISDIRNGEMSFSSGAIKREDKDTLATRYLRKNKKYIWIK